MSSSSTTTETRSFEELLEVCNKTELTQLCRQMGLQVDGNLPASTLMQVLLGEADEVESPVNKWRRMIMCFLLDNWAQVFSQLTCPAKSGDTDACFNCEDAQVAYCIVENRGALPLIRRYENMSGAIQMVTIDTVELDAEKLKNMGVVVHKKLAEGLERAGYPLWSNDMQKTSWLTQDPGARAATLINQLVGYRQNGAVQQQQQAMPVQQMMPQQMMPQQQQMMPQQMVQQPMVQQPLPAAPAQTVDDREPVNSKKKTTKAAAAATDLAPVLAELAKLNGSVDALTKAVEQLGAAVSQGNVNTAFLLRTQKTVLGLLSIFGQNILEMDTANVITMGDQEGDSAGQALQQVRVAKGEVKA